MARCLSVATIVALAPGRMDGNPETGGSPVAVEEVAQLAADLTHEDFARRETATRRLGEIGLPGLDLVLKAAMGSDPEASSRAARVLIIYADSFEDRVVEPAVAKLKQLNTLNVPGCKLTADGISRLRELLPNCEITTE